MATNTVGSRELKTRLGSYLRKVRNGKTLIVTDRGEPIAELRPVSSATGLPAALLKMVADGTVTLPTRPKVRFAPVKHQGPSLSDAITEDRKDRF